MGIKDLYNIIKKYAPDCLITYDLTELNGYRMAVDISIFLYKYIRSAGEEKWIDVFILFLCNLKKYGIKAICIFDGPNPPKEKAKEHEERRINTQKIKDRLKECIEARDLIFEKYIKEDDIPQEFIERCQHLIRPKRGFPDVTDYNDIQDICNNLTSTIERLTKQTISISQDFSAKAFKIVELLGLTALKAKGEAETYCSYLAVKGYVDGVLTEDTDVLVYGTPIMFAFKDFKLQEKKVYGIYLPALLEELELTLDEFKDLCIMLECDYNKRIKGIGLNASYELIKKYKKIEEIEKQCGYDTTPLKYKRCRKLFSVPLKVKNVIQHDKPPLYEELQEFIIRENSQMKIDYIRKCCTPTIIEFSSDEE